MLMLVEPRIQVNFVVHAPAPELHARHIEIGEERHADGEVRRGLLRGEAARDGEWEKRGVGRSFVGWPVVVRPECIEVRVEHVRSRVETVRVGARGAATWLCESSDRTALAARTAAGVGDGPR